MTADFAALKTEWKDLLQETLDHSYLHNWQDPIVEPLKSCQPGARLLPFPGDPTTELLAVLLFHKMDTIFKASSLNASFQVDSILVEETPTNHIQCGREFYLKEISNLLKFDGWWNKTSTGDRSFVAL